MTVENYHLKWDSHLTHLNTSIAALHRNDKFSDVLLYSSSPDCGFPKIGISAHKFILSASSQFFASIFDSSLSAAASSGVFHVVLPPELTQRTIQILVQYIYSGEATVPNDILSEVLRGGELLKIRGLCRTTPIQTDAVNESQKAIQKPNPIDNNNGTRFASELRGLGASVLPEVSPVIVKAPNPPQLGMLRIVNCNSIAGGISVNKEVAIDPDPDEPKFPYPETNPPNNIPTIRTSCRESGCSGCPAPTEMECPTEIVQVPKLTMRTDLHRNNQSIEENSSTVHNVSYRRVSLPIESVTSVKPSAQTSPIDQSNCFQIKEEPADCWLVDQSQRTEAPTPASVPKIVLKLKVPRETVPAPIKLEDPLSTEEECIEPPQNSVDLLPYTRLICETCKQTFDEPKDWVRHIETHVDKPDGEKDMDQSSFNHPSSKITYVPKKRRRASPNENSGAHVALMCDLCTMSFATPAEWVRHINTQHTETELAMFNSQRNASQQKPEAEVQRYSRRHHSGGTFKASVKNSHRNNFVSCPTSDTQEQFCDFFTE